MGVFLMAIVTIVSIVFAISLNRSNKKLDNKIDKLSRDNKKLVKTNKELEHVNKDLTNEIASLVKNNDVLTKHVKNLLSTNEQLRQKLMTPAELKAKRNKKKRDEGYRLWSDELSKNLADGTTKFIWRSMEDRRVCEKCREMDGKVFTKKEVPKLRKFVRQHKGDYGCRCYLDAVN